MAPSPSPGPPVIPEPKLGSPGLLAPETLPSKVDPAVRGRKCEKNQAAAARSLEPIDEAWGNEENKQKICKHGEGHRFPWQSAVSGPPIFVEEKTANVVAPEQGKRRRMRVKEQKQSSQWPLLSDVHSQGGKEAAEVPKCKNVAVRTSTHMPSMRKIMRMRIEARKQQPLPEGFLDLAALAANPSTNSIEKNSNYSSPLRAYLDQFRYKSDHKRKHISPPFPKPLDHPARSLPGGHLSFEPAQLASSGSSKAANTQILNATAPLSQEIKRNENQDVTAPLTGLVEQARGSEAKKRKRCKHMEEPVSLLQSAISRAPILAVEEKTANEVAPVTEPGMRKQSRVKELEHSIPLPLLFNVHLQGGKEASEGPKYKNVAVKSMTHMPSNNEIIRMRTEARKSTLVKAANPCTNDKKQKKPKSLLTAAEKRSDKYRRMPLDQLVPSPRSPHKLLQENYAADPWKVIVICMLLNRTRGTQVKKKVKGFFKQYPDPQMACCADPAKMAKYLKPLGLHTTKTETIQIFSKDYVEKEWTYITELHGVGKYAADAYAIFCAGRAREVVPNDHKLVDYWNYVCFELPFIQGSGNAQEPGATDQLEKVVPKLLESDSCC